MQRTPGPGSNPAPRGDGGARSSYVYPERLTAEERAEVDRMLDVDAEAYLRWLAGDGPDPCSDESRE